MDIRDFLSPTRCVVGNTTTKLGLLEYIGTLTANHSENLGANALLEALIARETLSSTGVGGGCALPHCRFRGASQVVVSVVKLDTPIAFGAPDRLPVDIFVLVVIPTQALKSHLLVLNRLAHFLKDPNIGAALRKVKTNAALYKKFTQLFSEYCN